MRAILFQPIRRTYFPCLVQVASLYSISLWFIAFFASLWLTGWAFFGFVLFCFNDSNKKMAISHRRGRIFLLIFTTPVCLSLHSGSLKSAWLAAQFASLPIATPPWNLPYLPFGVFPSLVSSLLLSIIKSSLANANTKQHITSERRRLFLVACVTRALINSTAYLSHVRCYHCSNTGPGVAATKAYWSNDRGIDLHFNQVQNTLLDSKLRG